MKKRMKNKNMSNFNTLKYYVPSHFSFENGTQLPTHTFPATSVTHNYPPFLKCSFSILFETSRNLSVLKRFPSCHLVSPSTVSKFDAISRSSTNTAISSIDNKAGRTCGHTSAVFLIIQKSPQKNMKIF